VSRPAVAIGVSGGIAAYKTANLVSLLVKADIDVHVVMTPSAQQFIGAATFAALSGHRVHSDIFDPSMPLGAHIEIARACDILCVAPATADLMAKSAHGLADDLLTTLYLAFSGPVLMCPAMNKEMWDKNAVQRNVKTLEEDGVQMVGPESGWQSCRDVGSGRMSEPDQILQAIRICLSA